MHADVSPSFITKRWACVDSSADWQVLTKDDPSLWPTLSLNVQVIGARCHCEPSHRCHPAFKPVALLGVYSFV